MMLIAATVLVLAALAFTFFVRTKDIPEPVPVSPTQHLDDRKQAIYENLRDLQFEYRLGKLSDEDYQYTKLSLQRELAVVLKETEEIVRKNGGPAVPKPAPTPATAVAAQASVISGTGKVCLHCGAKFAEALRFCGECGKAMA
jgi:hypothetical protein